MGHYNPYITRACTAMAENILSTASPQGRWDTQNAVKYIAAEITQ